LSILKLNNNRIGIQGIQFLMKIFKTNKLIEIDLSNNQIGNEGIQIIADLLQTNTVISFLFLLLIFYSFIYSLIDPFEIKS